jgi:hypothetical protein
MGKKKKKKKEKKRTPGEKYLMKEQYGFGEE